MDPLSCPVCSSRRHQVFTATVLNRHAVAFNQCPACGLLQSEYPHWLEEAYASPIALTDTGLVQRNLVIAVRLAAFLHWRFRPSGPYVDVAGGHGLLVRLMRDLGFDFYWEDKYAQNILAKGFDASATPGGFVAATAFEVLEHLIDPCAFLDEIVRRTGARTVVFSTCLYRGKQPPPPEWWYYSFETGQHVSFYRRETLERIAARLGMSFHSAAGLHVLSDRPVSNRIWQSLLLGPLALPAALLARWRRGSRTVSDHRELTKRLRTVAAPAPASRQTPIAGSAGGDEPPA